MKKYLFYIIILYPLLFCAQEYSWTGNTNNIDFFDELNWKETTTNLNPEAGSINSSEEINFNLFITCDVIADGEILLNINNKISIISGELTASKISGSGELFLGENSYLNVHDSIPISTETIINISSNNSWIRFFNVNPEITFNNYLNNFTSNNQNLIYPQNLRLDNYYNNGTVIRSNDNESTKLEIFSDFNQSGSIAAIPTDNLIIGESIPNNLNDDISSFNLQKGYMVTLAENEDGTGKSKVFIASEDNLVINELSEYLNNKISFIRVIPWNWVTKKGTAGQYDNINSDWFYKWSNNGNSELNKEYVPMTWGKAAADQENDIEILLNKYKSTHLLAFNEPDDCNGQSGQYSNMCVVDTSLTYYKNLLKTGLRMASPACRQGAVFNWLVDFNEKAINQDIRIDVIAVHWYDWSSNPENSPNESPNAIFNRFTNYLENVYNIYGLPIWITEFNANIHRNEWVHRQFLQLAMPYLEELDYVERYSFFPPVNDVADLYNLNNELTQIGTYYNDFLSSKSISDNYLISTNNLNNDYYENNFTPSCDPDQIFLNNNSIDEFEDKFIIFPNPSSKFLNITHSNKIRDLKIFSLNGSLIKTIKPSKSINISYLEKGIYIFKINDNYIKFIKK